MHNYSSENLFLVNLGYNRYKGIIFTLEIIHRELTVFN